MSAIHSRTDFANRTPTGDLPTTAYLVLGVLAANDEQLTAGEIKLRAELSVGYFYSHAGKRAITLYDVTPGGLERPSQVGSAISQPRPRRHQTPRHPQNVVGEGRKSRQGRRCARKPSGGHPRPS